MGDEREGERERALLLKLTNLLIRLFYLFFVALPRGRSHFISIPSRDSQDSCRMNMRGKFGIVKKKKEQRTRESEKKKRKKEKEGEKAKKRKRVSDRKRKGNWRRATSGAEGRGRELLGPSANTVVPRRNLN